MKKFSILNSQFSISKGFTLIELLVVMGIFITVAAVASGILFSTLRGSQKSTTIDDIRQNGNFALNTMTKNIRESSRLLSSCSPSMSSIDIEARDNSTISYTCDTVNKKITANGSSLTSGQVELVSCNFSCTQASGLSPTVKIQFRLSQSGAATFVENTGLVDFETTVNLRNSQSSLLTSGNNWRFVEQITAGCSFSRAMSVSAQKMRLAMVSGGGLDCRISFNWGGSTGASWIADSLSFPAKPETVGINCNETRGTDDFGILHSVTQENISVGCNDGETATFNIYRFGP